MDLVRYRFRGLVRCGSRVDVTDVGVDCTYLVCGIHIANTNACICEHVWYALAGFPLAASPRYRMYGMGAGLHSLALGTLVRAKVS